MRYGDDYCPHCDNCDGEEPEIVGATEIEPNWREAVLLRDLRELAGVEPRLVNKDGDKAPNGSPAPNSRAVLLTPYELECVVQALRDSARRPTQTVVSL